MERKNIDMRSSTRGIVIAGLAGGSGKSVVSVGLAAAWARMGRKVAPFKKGPDYIDAGWLQCGAENSCYNLDPYLVPMHLVSASFKQRSTAADIALVEGNRGLYDGVNAQGVYSTAELALALELPVVLVVNCSKTTRTIAALVLGCMKLDERVNIVGVILNQVATKRQVGIITEAVELYCRIPVLGAVPRMKKDIFPMRHLGMIPHQEYEGSREAIDFLADTAEQNIDMARLEAQMPFLPDYSKSSPINLVTMPAKRDVKIGILQDAAFQFYYPENLFSLERCGAELVRINALTDTFLPDIDGLYIGGGFPETSARELAANGPFRRSLKTAIDSGLPVYAECGGLIYLGSSIILEGKEYPLTGIFPSRFTMSKKPQAHGYSIFTVEKENPFYEIGAKVKGHEFRYSVVSEWPGAPEDLVLNMERGTGFKDRRDGLIYKNVLALYTHVHAEGTPEWASGFVNHCRKNKSAQDSGLGTQD